MPGQRRLPARRRSGRPRRRGERVMRAAPRLSLLALCLAPALVVCVACDNETDCKTATRGAVVAIIPKAPVTSINADTFRQTEQCSDLAAGASCYMFSGASAGECTLTALFTDPEKASVTIADVFV